MKSSLQEINKQKRRQVASLADPTPGEMVQRGDDDDDGPNFVNAPPPADDSAGVSGPSILEALGQQQDTMETVRAANTKRKTSETQHTSLGTLFTPTMATATAPAQKENLEFHEPGAIDFRAALLAEQEQQQAILAERQRLLEESHTHNHESKPVTASSLDGSASPKSSVILTHPQAPISILKSPAGRAHSSNFSDTVNPNQIMASPEDHVQPMSPQLLHPAAASAHTPGSSAPNDDNTNLPAGHNRKVSWGVDRFHITSDNNTKNDGLESQYHAGMHSEQSAPAATGRPRLLSEDSKIDLRSIIGTTPFESEAETNILRAVDEFRMQDQYARVKSESPPFFNLPPEFSLPPPEIPSPNNNDATRISGHNKMLSELSGGSMGSPLPRPQFTPDPSVLDGSLESRQPASPQRERPKQRPSLEKVKGNRRLPAHRHTQSVEQRLFGLTTALTELDKKSIKRVRTDSVAPDSPGSIVDQQLAGEERSSMQKSHRRFVSSADRLAERAQILVSRAMGGKGKNALPVVVAPMASGNGGGDDIEAPPGDKNDAVNHSRAYSGDSAPQQTAGSDISGSDPPTPVSTRGRHPSTIQEDDEEDKNHSGNGGEDSGIFQKKSGMGILGTLNPSDFLNEAIREDWETFTEFLNPRRKSAWVYCKNILLFLILPSTAIATLFFYFIEDNVTSESASITENTTTTVVDPEFEFAGASVSWWILFIGVRQVLTLSLAFATQSFVIDFLVLGSRFSLRCLGPVVTLLLVQSKGWYV